MIALPVGITLTLEGQHQGNRSIIAFDAKLPGLLYMRELMGPRTKAP